MKHLFALLFLLLAVSTAWSNTTAPAAQLGTADQVDSLQHQEAAFAAALDQDVLDLVGTQPDAVTGARLAAPHTQHARALAVLDDVSLLPSHGPETPVHALLKMRPLSGHRSPVETSGPAFRESVAHLRCPSGGITLSFPLHATISSGA